MDIIKNIKVFCLITGGSRGFGRALALSMSGNLGAGSCLALVARNETDLVEVKERILEINDSLSVVTILQDLSQVSSQDADDVLKNAIATGKAARELYFKVLAEEFPNTLVLNYSPGPMVTEMTEEIMRIGLPSIQEWFLTAKSAGNLIPCERSVKKLMHFLTTGEIKSGGRVDYYDIKLDGEEDN